MPEYRNSVTLGNMIQIGAMLVALAMAWATLDAKAASAQREIEDHEVRLRSMEAQVLTTLARLDERMARIEAASRR